MSEDPSPPSSIAPQPIEPAIDDVILRALSKRPEDRYATAADFSAALARALEMKPPAPPPRPPPRRSSLPLTLLVIVGAAALSAVVTLLLHGVP